MRRIYCMFCNSFESNYPISTSKNLRCMVEIGLEINFGVFFFDLVWSEYSEYWWKKMLVIPFLWFLSIDFFPIWIRNCLDFSTIARLDFQKSLPSKDTEFLFHTAQPVQTHQSKCQFNLKYKQWASKKKLTVRWIIKIKLGSDWQI